MKAPAYPAPAATSASAGRQLAKEFAAWQIDFRPGSLDVVTAYWRSPDGRSRRYVVRRSSTELLARLREIGPECTPGRTGGITGARSRPARL
jgi:hypothetical protein